LEPAVLPQLLIRQNPTRISISLHHLPLAFPRVAEVVTSAAFAEIVFLLVILVCKSLLQKYIVVQGLLPLSGARL